jgi:hypothetical protein
MAERMTRRRVSPYDMKHCYLAGGTIEAGKAVMIAADGDVEEAGAADGVSLGRACESVSSGEYINVDQGIFSWEQGAGTTIAKAHRGLVVYWEDDETVSLTPVDGQEAGVVYDVDDFGIWVLTTFDLLLNKIGKIPTGMGTAGQVLEVNAGATALEFGADS